MSATWQAQFSSFEKDRKNLFEDLKSYDDEVINKKPTPEAWSIAQVVEHLILSEESSLAYLQKKVKDTSKIPVAGFGSTWKYGLLQVIFMVGNKYKAPTMIVPRESHATIANLDARWAKVRSETFALLSSLLPADIEKALWKHPSAGKMNIHQMIGFLHIHFNRHRKQIYNTLAQVVL